MYASRRVIALVWESEVTKANGRVRLFTGSS